MSINPKRRYVTVRIPLEEIEDGFPSRKRKSKLKKIVCMVIGHDYRVPFEARLLGMSSPKYCSFCGYKEE